MGFMNYLKVLLHIFNIIFICVGITLVGIGIWTAVAKVFISLVVGDSLFRAASYLIIAVGFITIIVCSVGLVAVLKEKQQWLWAYIGLLVLCFCMLITAAILAVVFKTEVESKLVGNMRKSLIEKYYQDRDVTDAWDQLQSDFQCCAVSQTVLEATALYSFPYIDESVITSEGERLRQDSWPIYKRTEFFRQQLTVGVNDRKYVPESCCRYDSKIGDYADLRTCQNFPTGPPTNFEINYKNDYLFYEGCYSKARSLMLNQSDIIVAMGFVFGFVMIAGMVLTYLVLRLLKEEEEERMKDRRRPENHDASLDLL